MKNITTLGILGGLGPMSGIYFCEMLTEHTSAECDREHINFLLSSRADTPDRTDFILGRSSADPSSVMISEANKLIAAGAELIAIPCNTAHYFYESISAAADVPVINIIEQTTDFCASQRISSIGVLATEGTVVSGAYERVCRRAGIEYITPTPDDQAIISHIIYNEIKRGRTPDIEAFRAVSERLLDRGAERLILGCTELSLLNKNFDLGDKYIDSLEVLAYAAIRLCGKEPRGFDSALMSFEPRLSTPQYL